jgi:hypothetical protein
MNKRTKGIKRGQERKKGENFRKEDGVDLEGKRRRKLINKEKDWRKEQEGEGR